MARRDEWLVVAPLVALCLSGAASSALLAWLCRLRKRHWQKLMARQLWHLCVADVFFVFFGILDLIGGTVFFWKPDAACSTGMNILCSGIAIAYSIGLLTSVMVEAHMAVSFAAAMYRWRRVLWVQNRILVWVWPLAAMIAAVEIGLDRIRYDPRHGCQRDRPDVIGFLLLVSCFAVCLVCYVCSAVRARKAGDAIRRRVWNRANWYIMVALVSFGPNAKRILTEVDGGDGDRWFHTLSLVLFNLNGLLNGIVYAVQSSYVRRARRAQTQRTQQRRLTASGEACSVDEETCTSSEPRSPRIANQGSFHVAFQEERAVFEVSPVPSDTGPSEDEGQRQGQSPSAASASSTPVVGRCLSAHSVQNVGSADSGMSDSEELLGCFEASPGLGLLAGFDDGGDEEHEGFPAHIFVVGSPPPSTSPLTVAARRSQF